MSSNCSLLLYITLHYSHLADALIQSDVLLVDVSP